MDFTAIADPFKVGHLSQRTTERSYDLLLAALVIADAPPADHGHGRNKNRETDTEQNHSKHLKSPFRISILFMC
jgi:hypothetical protein